MGLPAFVVVGLPQGAVREGRERVTAALHNDRTLPASPSHHRELGTGRRSEGGECLRPTHRSRASHRYGRRPTGSCGGPLLCRGARTGWASETGPRRPFHRRGLQGAGCDRIGASAGERAGGGGSGRHPGLRRRWPGHDHGAPDGRVLAAAYESEFRSSPTGDRTHDSGSRRCSRSGVREARHGDRRRRKPQPAPAGPSRLGEDHAGQTPPRDPSPPHRGRVHRGYEDPLGCGSGSGRRLPSDGTAFPSSPPHGE